MGDGNSTVIVRPKLNEEEEAFWRKKIEDLRRGIRDPDVVAYQEERVKEMKHRYISVVTPKLRPAVADDSVKGFYQVYSGWGGYMLLRGYLMPDILPSMVSRNALRCARAALEGSGSLNGRRSNPNARNRHGYAPLHMAAQTFCLDMAKLLLRHGASANVRTEGEDVIEDLLPVHVAVENTSMHKYLEDHWADGDPVENLIFLLCLPEMKMFLDTTRLIAKHTDNIVDELWNYIEKEKLVQAAILMLAAQKQLRDPLDKSTRTGIDNVKDKIAEELDALHREILVMVKEGKNGRALKKLKDKKEELLTTRIFVGVDDKDGQALKAHEVSLNGFDIVKSHIDEALKALHRKGLAMVQEGKNGKALKELKSKKEAFLTAHALVDIVHKAGEALEEYIQAHSRATHEEILGDFSSILSSCGIVHFGKGIDTGKLECYRYRGQVPTRKSSSKRVEGDTDEADKSTSLEDYGKKRVREEPSKGLAIRGARDLFFPYWKSVLSARLPVQIAPPCQPSRKDMRSTEPSKTTAQVCQQVSFINKRMECPSWIARPNVWSSYGSRRQFCAVALMSLKVFKRA